MMSRAVVFMLSLSILMCEEWSQTAETCHFEELMELCLTVVSHLPKEESRGGHTSNQVCVIWVTLSHSLMYSYHLFTRERAHLLLLSAKMYRFQTFRSLWRTWPWIKFKGTVGGFYCLTKRNIEHNLKCFLKSWKKRYSGALSHDDNLSLQLTSCARLLGFLQQEGQKRKLVKLSWRPRREYKQSQQRPLWVLVGPAFIYNYLHHPPPFPLHTVKSPVIIQLFECKNGTLRVQFYTFFGEWTLRVLLCVYSSQGRFNGIEHHITERFNGHNKAD